MSEENSNTKLNWLIAGANWAAIAIVLFATIGLMCIVFKVIDKDVENTAPKEIIVKYEITVDTFALKKLKDPKILKTVSNIDENNKRILEEINSSVDAQYKRMESILTVQEDRSKLFSYGAGFLAILVAIATFFGFKSINEMKKGTIDVAEYEAQKIAEAKAKEVAEKVAEAKTKEELATKLEIIKNELQSSLISDFQGKLDQRELNVSDEFKNSLSSDFYNKLNEFRDEFFNSSNHSTPEPSNQVETKNDNEIPEDFSDEANPNSNDESLFNDNDL